MNMNIRGGVDSLFTWIIAVGLIIFIMALFVFFTMLLFGKYALINTNEVTVATISSPLEKNILFLLQEEMIIDGKNMRVMDGIYQTLDSFMRITNEDGKNIVNVFGMQMPSMQLRGQMFAKGFDEDDWDALIDAHRQLQEGELVKILQKKLSLRCDREYFLAVPFGIVTRDGLKSYEAVQFHDDDASLLRYTSTQSYPFIYKQFHFTINFRMSKECAHE